MEQQPLPSALRSLTAGDAHGAFSFADGVTTAAWCRLFAEAYAAAPADAEGGSRAGAGAPARPATRRCLAIVHGRRHLFVYEPRRGRTHEQAPAARAHTVAVTRDARTRAPEVQQ